MSKPILNSANSDVFSLPSYKHSIIEKKHKNLYVLTRKETETFITYMCYFLYTMVNGYPEVEKYRLMLKYFNDTHSMDMLNIDVHDEQAFIEWDIKCSEAEIYLETNISKIFENQYTHDVLLSERQAEYLKEEILVSIKNKKVELPTIDMLLNSGGNSFERLTRGFTQNDLNHSGFFIRWQAIRALTYYAYNDVNQQLYLSLALRMVESLKIEASKDEQLMPDFIAALKNMWH